MRQFYRYMLLFLVIAFLAVFLIGPVYTVVEVGLDWRLLGEVFSNYIYVEGLLNSFCIAAVTTLMVFAISLPLALLYDRYEFPGKNWCNLLMMLPMILPPFVGALGFQQILGHYGVVNTLLASCGFEPVDFLGGRGRFWSVCFIEALHLYPILYLNLVTALGNLDPQLNEAARNLGAPWWTRFRRITLPLMKPGIFAGGSISEISRHYLNQHNIMGVSVGSKFDLRRICKTLNATALVRVGPPTPEEIGECSAVDVMEVGGKRVTVLKQESGNGRVATVVIRGSTENLMEDVERAVGMKLWGW